ncbi:SPOR domain-containing protein, partial [Thermodesulfobacteriota bacterium]
AASFVELFGVKLDLGEKGVWYRLFAGYFQTRKEADEFIKTMKMQGAESKLTKHANFIGTYSSKEDIEKYKTRLEEQGYSPYIINDAEDTYQLYIGAFYQKDRAEEQNSDLALDGIESELVER